MKLKKQDQEFRNPKVFYPDPKHIDLDRVLINLYMLLRCNGSRPVSRGPSKAAIEQVEHHLRSLSSMTNVTGFTEHPHIAKAWLESDILDLVNRGTTRQAVASLRPLHLDAYKIRVQRHCRDYNVADTVYAFLEFGEAQALKDLRQYLDRGRDDRTGRYDGRTELDLETLTVLKLVAGLDNLHPSGEKVAEAPPTCIGQARVLADDVQRLLAYQDIVPRPVMIDYLKTIFGLHVGLYTMRVAHQLTGWVRDKQAHPACLECPVNGTRKVPFEGCPYQLRLVVDMGTDFRTRMAALSQQSVSSAYAKLLDLIKSLFTINQLLRYSREDPSLGIPNEPAQVLQLLSHPPAAFEPDFRAKLKQIRNENEDLEQEPTAEERAIFDMDLPSFEKFIELVTQVRQKHHRAYLVELVDTLFQKNAPYGAMVQGKSRVNQRRWQLGGRLLEVFVQLAVLQWEERDHRKLYHSQPMLVDDFLGWLEARYGFVVGMPAESGESRGFSVEDHRAFRQNVRSLKDRLREIGFYDDLSDAYNAQLIKPRYPIDQRAAE